MEFSESFRLIFYQFSFFIHAFPNMYLLLAYGKIYIKLSRRYVGSQNKTTNGHGWYRFRSFL